jgi:anti-anti-sigma regulatory factor
MSLRNWIRPRSTDERVAWQEQLVNILALVSFLLSSAYVLVLVFDALALGDAVLLSIGGGSAAVALTLVSYAFSRRGHVRAAAVLIVSASMLIGLYSGYVRGAVTVSAMLLVPAIIFAGAAISGRAGIVVAAVEFAACAGLAFVQAQGWLRPPGRDLSPLTGLVLIGAAVALIALVLWQTLRAQESLLLRAEERGRALQTLADDKDRLLTELQAREEAQRRLLETIRELGSPIIPLARGIIALPLIGTMDSGRSQQMMSALLQGVADHRARAVIVDVTGVPVVDTAVAGALLRAAQGVRLLGATPILVGIRPEVARTLIEMGLGMEGIVTQASLQDGLVYALDLVGAEIVARAVQDPASLALELQEKR